MTNEVPEKPWTYLIVTFITKLPIIAKKDVVLIVCNRLSKIVYFVATTEEISAEELARLFRDNMWKLYVLLESIILDKGLQFTAKLTKELNKILEIETRLSIIFHP